jgi:hypothetical protein
VTSLIIAAASVIVTGFVGYYGAQIQGSVAGQATANDIFKLALEILRSDPNKDPASEPLREWAVETLVSQSRVPISKEAQAQLKSNSLSIIRETLYRQLLQDIDESNRRAKEIIDSMRERTAPSTHSPTPKTTP